MRRKSLMKLVYHMGLNPNFDGLPIGVKSSAKKRKWKWAVSNEFISKHKKLHGIKTMFLTLKFPKKDLNRFFSMLKLYYLIPEPKITKTKRYYCYLSWAFVNVNKSKSKFYVTAGLLHSKKNLSQTREEDSPKDLHSMAYTNLLKFKEILKRLILYHMPDIVLKNQVSFVKYTPIDKWDNFPKISNRRLYVIAKLYGYNLISPKYRVDGLLRMLQERFRVIPFFDKLNPLEIFKPYGSWAKGIYLSSAKLNKLLAFLQKWGFIVYMKMKNGDQWKVIDVSDTQVPFFKDVFVCKANDRSFQLFLYLVNNPKKAALYGYDKLFEQLLYKVKTVKRRRAMKDFWKRAEKQGVIIYLDDYLKKKNYTDNLKKDDIKTVMKFLKRRRKINQWYWDKYRKKYKRDKVEPLVREYKEEALAKKKKKDDKEEKKKALADFQALTGEIIQLKHIAAKLSGNPKLRLGSLPLDKVGLERYKEKYLKIIYENSSNWDILLSSEKKLLEKYIEEEQNADENFRIVKIA